MPEYDVYAIPQAGFRRAGIVFKSNAPTRINSKNIELNKLEQILSEKMLRVVPAGLPGPGEDINCPGCGVIRVLGGLSLRALRAVATDKGIKDASKMQEPDLMAAICKVLGEPEPVLADEGQGGKESGGDPDGGEGAGAGD